LAHYHKRSNVESTISAVKLKSRAAQRIPGGSPVEDRETIHGLPLREASICNAMM
jgi:hypothetical protein